MPRATVNMVDAIPTDASEQLPMHTGEMFHKTKMCKFNQTGSCTRGRDCAFAHSTFELQYLPDLYKTHLCVRFSLSGSCKKGVACQYAHGVQELRGVQNKRGKIVTPGKSEHKAMNGSPNQCSGFDYQTVVPCVAVPVVAQAALIVQVSVPCHQHFIVGQGTADDSVGNLPKFDMGSWNPELLNLPTAPNFVSPCAENSHGYDNIYVKQGVNQRCSVAQWNSQVNGMIQELGWRVDDEGKPAGYFSHE